MAKFFTVLVFVSLLCSQISGQWQTSGTTIYNTNSGNVGIGTTNPSGKLHILDGNNNIRIGDFGNVSIAGIELTDGNIGSGSSVYLLGWSNSFRISTNGFDEASHKFTILNDGNIGIGLNNPTEKLQVKGNLFLNQQNPTLYWSGNSLNLTSKDNCIPVFCLRGTTSYNPRFDMYKAVTGERTIVLDAGSDCFFNSGKVGIGTTNPQNLLDVNGTIHAREVKVDLTGWSDFVFHPSYQLKPLSEVEKYIKTNGHLHDIPSAAEVEQNGVNVGEMQKKLLQKQEETILYLIEMTKQIETIKLENLQLKADKEDLKILLKEMKSEIDQLKSN